MKEKEWNVAEIPPAEVYMITKDERDDLLKLMCDLEILDRDIIVRKFFQYMPSKDIAIHMGLRESTVDKRINYVMKKWKHQDNPINK